MVFDASPAWCLHQDPEGVRHVVRSGGKGDAAPPLWTATIPPDFRSIRVGCGPELARPDHLLDPLCYPLDQILLLHLLADSRMLLVHGACIAMNGGASVFAGVSGAGKTTLSRLFARRDASAILTDDRVLLVKTDNGWMAGGTPWPGEGRFARNIWRPLQRILFLEKAGVNGHEKLDPRQAFERLLPVLSIPWFDEVRTGDLLSLVEDLLATTPTSVFRFTPDLSSTDPTLHGAP